MSKITSLTLPNSAHEVRRFHTLVTLTVGYSNKTLRQWGKLLSKYIGLSNHWNYKLISLDQKVSKCIFWVERKLDREFYEQSLLFGEFRRASHDKAVKKLILVHQAEPFVRQNPRVPRDAQSFFANFFTRATVFAEKEGRIASSLNGSVLVTVRWVSASPHEVGQHLKEIWNETQTCANVKNNIFEKLIHKMWTKSQIAHGMIHGESHTNSATADGRPA